MQLKKVVQPESHVKEGGDWLRIFEKLIIITFLVCALIAVIFSIAMEDTAPLAMIEAKIEAHAYAMPDNGWAPLFVHFSALGTKSQGAPVVRYEWDLDGNGSFETDATANGGYASYTYSKPRDYVISMRATDQNGGTAITSTVVSVRHPASSSVDYWTIFDDSRVRRIDVRLNESDWDKMWDKPEAKYQVKADAIVFGEELKDIGFRMRGQFSLLHSGDKKPWKIDTDAYIDGQEYHNLRQLMLLNNIGDPSLLKEKLAYEMMAFAGLPASHAAFVELWIDLNDDDQPPIFWGIYLMVERVDNKYIANRFGQEAKGGNLYKASHAQRGPMNLVYYGEAIEDYPTQNGQYPYGKMNNEAEADYSDIIALMRTIEGTASETEAAYIQALESSLNVDAFLRYLAVNAIINNWDSYPDTCNNYYLLNNSVSGRFEWIPWDLTWGDNAETSLFEHGDTGLSQGAPLFDRVMMIEKYRSAYIAYLDLLGRYWFTTGNLSPLIKKYHTMLTPFVSQSTGDKVFYGDEPMFPYEVFQESGSELIRFVSKRSAYLQAELAQEMDAASNN